MKEEVPQRRSSSATRWLSEAAPWRARWETWGTGSSFVRSFDCSSIQSVSQSLSQSFIHALSHSFTQHSFVHLFVASAMLHWSVGSLNHWRTHSVFCSVIVIHAFIDSLSHSVIKPFVRWFAHSLLVHSFGCSFVRSHIQSFFHSLSHSRTHWVMRALILSRQ